MRINNEPQIKDFKGRSDLLIKRFKIKILWFSDQIDVYEDQIAKFGRFNLVLTTGA